MKVIVCLALIIGAALGLGPGAEALSLPRPIVLDAQDRPVVRSPDGRWTLQVVSGEADPWLVVKSSGGSLTTRLLPIMRSCEVLWRRDSLAFSVTDARFADHYFIFAGQKSGNSFRLVPLTPSLEGSLRSSLGGKYDVDKIYAKALRWLPNGSLLVGLNAVIFRHIRPLPSWQPAVELYRAYVMDATEGRVIHVLSRDAVLSQYHFDLERQDW